MTALLAALSLLVFTPDLTKNDVKRLVEAGISDDVIVSYIRKYGPMESLSPKDLVDLREAKVSEKVLAVMVESVRTPEAAPAESQETTPPVTYSYPWYYPSGYYYDYYSGPYAWWYVGPGRYVYPRYSYGYPYYRYPYYRYPYPYGIHPYRKNPAHPQPPGGQHGTRPPHSQPPSRPPTRPPSTQPHPQPQPPRPPSSTPPSAPHGGHR